MSNLARHGVSEAVLSLGYLPDRFVEAYPEFIISGLPVSYAVEPEPLDTAGAIGFAAKHARVEETFVVINGDVLTDLDLSRLVAFHHHHGAQGTISLHPVEDPSRFGVVPTDDDGRVLAFVEKPNRDDAPTNEINAGTYVLEPSMLELIEPETRVSVERMIFPSMAEKGTLFALADSSYWLDTGTPEAYLQAHIDIVSGRRDVPLATPLHEGSWIHPTAVVDPSARLYGATVDRNCVVGADVELRDAVLLPRSSVGRGARVVRSILGSDASVGEDATLGPICVLGAHQTVAPGAQYE